MAWIKGNINGEYRVVPIQQPEYPFLADAIKLGYGIQGPVEVAGSLGNECRVCEHRALGGVKQIFHGDLEEVSLSFPRTGN
jgi:hypothetical protein